MELHLKLENDELRAFYTEQETTENVGYDLFLSQDYVIEPKQKIYLKFGIKCQVLHDGEPVAYFLFPRSSISKTNLFMLNSVGVIDAGYRGDIMACVYNYGDETVNLDRGQRLFQLVPINNGKPFDKVLIVDELLHSVRGEGGFGSTGK